VFFGWGCLPVCRSSSKRSFGDPAYLINNLKTVIFGRRQIGLVVLTEQLVRLMKKALEIQLIE